MQTFVRKFVPMLLAGFVLAFQAAGQSRPDYGLAEPHTGTASSSRVYHTTAVDEEFRHDLRIVFGALPLFEKWDGDRDWDGVSWNTPAEEVLKDKYRNSFFGRHSFLSLSLLWSMRVGRSWEVGTTLSYAAFYDGLWRNSDNRKVGTLREYNLSLIPSVRYLWMNRSRFRLYSGLEAGVQLGLRHGFFEEQLRSRVVGTGQVTFLGLTVGRKFFFTTELGVGCRGVLNAGFGWWLDSKNRRR